MGTVSDGSTGTGQSGGSTGADSECGDGDVDPDETCDDGPDNGGHRRCGLGCVMPPISCQNGIKELGEECDDGNADDFDACIDCKGAARGDGVVDLADGHACDDGNTADYDGCPKSLKFDYYVAFLTAKMTSGNIGGVGAADAICQTEANEAGLSGVYKAWLSADGSSAAARGVVGMDPLGIFMPDGSGLGTWGDVKSKGVAKPLNITAKGIKADDLSGVWTNTRSTGEQKSVNSCKGWQDGSAGGNPNGGSGSPSASLSESWTDQGYSDCNMLFHLYCFQTAMASGACGDGLLDPSREACDDGDAADYDGCPASCRDDHRIIFVSKELTTGQIVHGAGPDMLVGLEAADAICQASAAAQNLSGTYAAWLSSTTESAYQRLGLPESVELRRLDGVPVAAGLDDLFDGTIDAAVGPGGSAARVWTNSRPSGAPASTRAGGACDDWKSAAQGNSAVQGDTGAANADWIAAPEADCSTQAALYCVQVSLDKPIPGEK